MSLKIKRITFSKAAKERVPLPDLLDIQLKAYKDFLQTDVPPTKRALKGLEGVFRSVFPIESTDGKFVIDYAFYEIGNIKYSENECFDKNLTYSVPVKAVFRLIDRETGEIKEKDIYIGDFPLMTHRGTFIINGAERVVVNQIYKSPGVLFSYKNKEFSSKIVPEKGSWLEFIIDTKKDLMYVRIDSRRKVLVTMFLRALGMSAGDIIAAFFDVKKVDLKKIDKEEAISRLVGKYIAEDVNDDEGNLIISAVDKLLPGSINQLYQKEKTLIKIINPKSILTNKPLINTLEKDDTKDAVNKAIKKIYSILHPGEAAPLESIVRELNNMFFSPKMYDLGEVGRYKLVLKLFSDYEGEDRNQLIQTKTLTFEDITRSLQHLLKVYNKEASLDDVDHLGNRRVRNVNELIMNQILSAFSKVEKAIHEKLSSRDVEEFSPQNIIAIKPIVSAINDFFGMSQLSQFMDQTNPIAELTHKRRLSALGPGGLSRDRAGFEVRDVHNTHYGRVCPIETPEGPNIGLIVSLATFAQVNPYGFLETPYVVVKNEKVTDEIKYLSATEEENFYIAQANIKLDKNEMLVEDLVQCRFRGEFELAPKDKIQLMDVAPKQILSVSASLIPFIEHDDANRALMGSNMQRQAMPLLISQSPIVGTGMEYYVARDARAILVAEEDGEVKKVDSTKIMIKSKGGEKTYDLVKFRRTNQDTSFNQKPIVDAGEKVAKGDVIADGFASFAGELALGRNILVAFMPWNGYNYEDAVLISEKLLKNDDFTSVYTTVFECKALETKLGSEEITSEIPNVGEDAVRNLDSEGIIRVGAYVKPGDILVGKVTPKGEPTETPEFRLLHAIFGEKAKDVRDTSLRVPHGEGGVVVDVKVFNASNNDELPPGVIKLVKVYIAKKRKIKPGDKIAGRHGNKGVISRVMAEEDMPYLPDGTPVDIVLNPLGVPSRMNLGQLFETLLGLAGWKLGVNYECPVFEGASLVQIEEELEKANKKLYDTLKSERKNYGEDAKTIESYYERVKLPMNGKFVLRDGRTGIPFENPVFVGVMYILKLHHMVDDKIHARSVGPYSLVTQQPLRGKANFGGQRLGEMEVWALEAYGAANLLQEMLTVKSDDTEGRVRIYEGIIKGKYVASPGIPESFNVLVQELRGLALDIQVYDKGGKRVPLNDKEKELFDTKISHLV
ncbi:MAG: DNA-directed RNA polymerase subunit beta [Spirochaetes bacterium GWF1_49_6]|nr:MAG: DNA-directed RNA polymerase subunit beta [Spirochaetes bacterium GWF1_49_6]